MANPVRQALDYADFATVPLAIAACLSIWPARDAAAPEILLGAVDVALGATAWTLVEYVVHRALHDKRLPQLRALHMRHHQHPAEASGGTLYSSAIILVLLATAIMWLPVAPAILGFLVGYLAFIVLHHAEHHGWDLSRVADLAEHHHRHHHARPRGCFGVTTSVWDRLFGTL